MSRHWTDNPKARGGAATTTTAAGLAAVDAALKQWEGVSEGVTSDSRGGGGGGRGGGGGNRTGGGSGGNGGSTGGVGGGSGDGPASTASARKTTSAAPSNVKRSDDDGEEDLNAHGKTDARGSSSSTRCASVQQASCWCGWRDVGTCMTCLRYGNLRHTICLVLFITRASASASSPPPTPPRLTCQHLL